MPLMREESTEDNDLPASSATSTCVAKGGLPAPPCSPSVTTSPPLARQRITISSSVRVKRRTRHV